MGRYNSITGSGARMDTMPSVRRLTTHHRPRRRESHPGHQLRRFSYLSDHVSGYWVTIAWCDCGRYADEHLSEVSARSGAASALQCWERNHMAKISRPAPAPLTRAS
jgi:hypothetical protein